MMLFIAGVLAAVTFFGLCALFYYLGTKHAHKVILEPTEKDKEKEQAKRSEGMQKILNYDVSVALKAKEAKR